LFPLFLFATDTGSQIRHFNKPKPPNDSLILPVSRSRASPTYLKMILLETLAGPERERRIPLFEVQDDASEGEKLAVVDGKAI
jgi:hypothetical protein